MYSFTKAKTECDLKKPNGGIRGRDFWDLGGWLVIWEGGGIVFFLPHSLLKRGLV